MCSIVVMIRKPVREVFVEGGQANDAKEEARSGCVAWNVLRCRGGWPDVGT